MSTIKERLKSFIEAKGISTAKFERSIGVQNAYVNSIRTGISKERLLQITKIYPDLNREWLLFGEGPMIKDEKTNRNISNIKYFPNFDGTMHQTEFVENPSKLPTN